MTNPFSIRVILALSVSALLLSSCKFPGFGKDTPPCGESALKIGETSYQIKETETRSDGSLKIPSDTPETAYWVNRTDINHVFALSPTSENLTLQNEKPEQAVLTWENCNSSTYVLSAPQAGVPDMDIVLDQSFSGITIFVQDDSEGFVIRGEFIGEEIQVFDTPDSSSAQAEVSLLETFPSTDKATLKVTVSIANVGQSDITLTPEDVSLLVRGSISTPIASEPALPKGIAPGSTETISFTFTYPETPSAILKIFNAEYELEGY